MVRVRSGGGFRAIWYSIKKGREAGGVWKLYKALRTKNACKTCALGMGGQAGGMVNETGGFPEVCKKSMQAMVADMQPAITSEFWMQLHPKFGRDRRLHIRDHRLHALFTDLGKATGFVDHAASLATHSQRTGLACVLRPQSLVQFPYATGLATFLDAVPNGAKATAAANSHHQAPCTSCKERHGTLSANRR